MDRSPQLQLDAPQTAGRKRIFEKQVSGALLCDSALTVEEVARQVGVSPMTLYRHLPGGRSGVSPAELG